MKPTHLLGLFGLFGLFGLPACTSTSVGLPSEEPPPPPPNATPVIRSITPPAWPPLSADGFIDVFVTDDAPNTRVTARFARTSVRVLPESAGTARIFGGQLGEGFGDLYIRACDPRGACRERRVEKLLVDLTAPEIFLEREIVSPLVDGPDGDVAVWVRDGWVLGSVEVAYLGTSQRHAFPAAYPSTLGTKPDVSRVAFPAKSFPAGVGMIEILATDAAGNVATKTVKLRIDATRPTVKLLEPSAGAKVGKSFVVRVEAADDSGAAPTVDVFVGGSRLLAGVPASTPFVIDTSTLTPGLHEVKAIARDEAGNESLAAEVTVDVLP
ncbi:MAG: hypothetical protein JST00_44300 [Deltaproteobacteria bacterium]|nr:hypothetical protein [Deltaproteobacteria bacterium]